MPAIQDINFIPDEIVKTRRVERTRNSGNKFFILITVLIGLAAGGIHYYNNTLNSHLIDIENGITTNLNEIANLQEFGKHGYKLGARLQNVKKILDTRPHYSRAYTEVLARIPENVTIVGWNVTEEGLFTISGRATPNYTPIADFRDNLLKTDPGNPQFFRDVKLISSTYDKSNGYIEFVLQLQFNSETLYGESN